jgi:hypothetical protein
MTIPVTNAAMQENSRISLITLAIAASPVCLPHYAPRIKGTLIPWQKGDGGRLKLGRDGGGRRGGGRAQARRLSIYIECSRGEPSDPTKGQTRANQGKTRQVAGRGISPLPQRLLLILEQRREQIAHHRALAGLDLHRHRHAGREIDHLVLDLHLRAVERDPRGIEQFLAFRLARGVVRAGHLVVRLLQRRFVPRDRVLRDAEHLAAQQAVAGEVEGIDLDLGILARAHEADIAVRQHGLDLEPALARHHHHQRLCRRDDAADRMHRKLLHHAVERRGKGLQPDALARLDQIVLERPGLGFRRREIARETAAIFGERLRPRLLDRRHRRFGFAQLALLDEQLLLLANEILQVGQIDELRPQFLVPKLLAHVDALLRHGDRRLQLLDRGGSGRALGFALRLLPVERADFGAMLVGLAGQILLLHGDERGACPLRRLEIGERIRPVDERRAQPRLRVGAAWANRAFTPVFDGLWRA